jgi:hypothetical protein
MIIHPVHYAVDKRVYGAAATCRIFVFQGEFTPSPLTLLNPTLPENAPTTLFRINTYRSVHPRRLKPPLESTLMKNIGG